jgi:multicomponent Na+:H+ antiporter subunit E
VRYVLAVVLLTLVYALALGDLYALDLVFGAGLATALVLVSRNFVFGADGAAAAGKAPPFARRILAFMPFCAVVLWEVALGTWEVALVTLRLRPLTRPGIVAVPIGERTVVGQAVWAITTGLPPGSFFVDIDRERGVALIHVLDASDPDAFRRHQDHFYRRYQSKVFP